jgi:HK97 family phage prohead protease
MRMQTLNLKLEIKALNDREFEGYGSVFNNMDLVGDVIAPGAFKSSLAEHNAAGTMPLMFWMHRPDQVAGAWVSMKEDKRGLAVKGELADTQLGNEMRTLLKMRALRGLSIGFRTLDSDWVDDDENGVHRVLKELDLVEVSLVSMAANPLAEVSAVKSRLTADGTYVPSSKETEMMLRKGGFSKAAARDMVFKMFGAGAMLEPEEDGKSGAMLDLGEVKIDRLLKAFTAEIKPATETTAVPFWRR